MKNRLATRGILLFVWVFLTGCGTHDSNPAYPYVLQKLNQYDKEEGASEHVFFLDLDSDRTTEVLRLGSFPLRGGLELKIDRWDGTVIDQVHIPGDVVSERLFTYEVPGTRLSRLLVPYLRRDSLFLGELALNLNADSTWIVREIHLISGRSRIKEGNEYSWDPDVRRVFVKDINDDGVRELVTVLRTNYAGTPRGLTLHNFETGAFIDSLHVGPAVNEGHLLRTNDQKWLLAFSSHASDNGISGHSLKDDEASVGVIQLHPNVSLLWHEELGGKNAGTLAIPMLRFQEYEDVLLVVGGGERTYQVEPALLALSLANGEELERFQLPYAARTGFGFDVRQDNHVEAWLHVGPEGLERSRGYVVVYGPNGDLAKRFDYSNENSLYPSIDLTGDGKRDLISVSPTSIEVYDTEWNTLIRLETGNSRRKPKVEAVQVSGEAVLVVQHTEVVQVYRLKSNNAYLIYQYKLWVIGVLLFCIVMLGIVGARVFIGRKAKSIDENRNKLIALQAQINEDKRDLWIQRHAWVTHAFPYDPRDLSSGRKRQVGLVEIEAALTDILLDKQYTVKALAKALEISTGHLQRLSDELVGLPPSELIRERRLNDVARSILKEDRKTLEAIAEEHGFMDYSSFSRRFKQKFGVPPSLFRSQHEGQHQA